MSELSTAAIDVFINTIRYRLAEVSEKQQYINFKMTIGMSNTLANNINEIIAGYENLKKQFENDYCLDAEKCKLAGVAMENHALLAAIKELRAEIERLRGKVDKAEERGYELAAEYIYSSGEKMMRVSARQTYAEAKAAQEAGK